jgi:hypothetical protein
MSVPRRFLTIFDNDVKEYGGANVISNTVRPPTAVDGSLEARYMTHS